MSYYAVPGYIGLSCTLCLIYGCIECVKEKGKLTTATHTILSIWCCVTVVITSLIMGIIAESTIGGMNMSHLLIVLLLASFTLSLSSGIIYFSK